MCLKVVHKRRANVLYTKKKGAWQHLSRAKECCRRTHRLSAPTTLKSSSWPRLESKGSKAAVGMKAPVGPIATAVAAAILGAAKAGTSPSSGSSPSCRPRWIVSAGQQRKPMEARNPRPADHTIVFSNRIVD